MRLPLSAPVRLFGLLFLGAVMAGALLAAQPPKNPADAPYAAEPLVLVSVDVNYRMQADGTGVEEKTVVARVQSESGLKQLAVLALGFAANSQHVEWIYARLRHPDGTVTETPTDSAIEVAEQVTREAPFYSDLKESQLPLKNLRVGDTLEWKGRIVRTKAEAAGQFWGQHAFVKEGVVVLAETLELDVPKGQSVQVWSPNFKPAETMEGERQIYRWSSASRKPTVGPEAEAEKEKEKKRIRTAAEELDDRQGKLADVAWTTFKNWEAVGAWYRGLEGERMLPDAEIKAKVAQLTAGKTTDEAKAQAVYAYVATQIHYIGVAFGVGRYQPHSADDVLSNQYGDCKDKHTLLAAMLGALGLKPDAVLIGPGIRFNEAVPSPEAFNHLITRVSLDGKETWLDTTAEVAPFGMLVYATRDKQALVVPETGAAAIMRTPANAPFPQTLTMDASGVLNAQGTSNSKITLTMRSDDEIALRSFIRQVSPAQYNDMIKRICASIGYIGDPTYPDFGRVEDTAQPLTVSFNYKREKAGDWPNLKVIPQLYPVTLPQPDEKDPPVESLQLGVPRVELSKAAMTLPEGWTVELPEAVHVKSAWATYDLTYRFEKGVLYTERRVEVLADKVPVADVKAYRKFVDKAEISGETYVQLVRSATKGQDIKVDVVKSDAADETSESGDISAQKLVMQAYEALQRKDNATAESLLNRAKAIKPEEQGLWVEFGQVSLAKGNISEAIADDEKELKLHPSLVQVYPMMVNTQVVSGRRSEAQETLRRWSAAAPEDPQPLSMLAQMQMDDGHADEAVKSANEALNRSKSAGGEPNEQIELLLGNAQMKAGQKEAAHATLLAIMKATDNPDMMNDAAYELADAGLELPLADQTTRTALDKLEEESRTWTLDESPKVLAQRTQMLQATWDTMGWILFREGKIADGEAYIKAAWSGYQSAEVGKHLAEIALARGDKDAALTYYELGMASEPQYDAMGVHKELDATGKAMAVEADKLRKAGAHSSASGSASLEKVRKLTIGPGKDGYAEYKLLINAQGLVKAAPLGDKTVPDAMDDLKRAKLSPFLPPGSKAQLVLARILNCHQGTCELVTMR